MTGQDVGFVGDIKKVNAEVLLDLLDKDFLPIVCPVGIDDDYNTYNINADDAAYSIAKAVHAEKLAFLSDIEGVYRDYEDKSSLITALTVDQANELIESGAISGGMIPKLQNCIDAIEEERLKTECPESIFWMEEFRTACFLKFSRRKVSELQF